jgi:N-acyl-D-aspartate/D-glutamate deacylase
VVATGVNGAVVFRQGEFREGYGKTVKSGRYLRAGVRHAPRSVGV